MSSVLLVDDEPLIRDVLSRGLALAGFEVCTATDGQAAWQLLSVMDVAVVVSDVHMPMMSGLELLKRVHGARPSTPVILMSGASDAASRADAMRQGAFDFLRKPMSYDVVVEATRRALCVEVSAQGLREARDRP